MRKVMLQKILQAALIAAFAMSPATTVLADTSAHQKEELARFTKYAGAPIDEFLQVYGIDEQGRVTLQIWFDVDDMDAAIAELDALHKSALVAERLAALKQDRGAA